MSKRPSPRFRAVRLGLAVILCAVQAAAATPATRDPLDPAEIRQWADQTFGGWVKEHRVSALAIAVTQGDHVVFLKGYGYADWATKKPVDPVTTQFRIASLTKTFTATAVAQLLEAGKIASLDDPINKYLKRVQLPKNAGKDITIWDCLTHRPGFAYNPPNDGSTPTAIPVPGALIKAQMPPYARPPGQISIYSNFGVSMLGDMVEDITGEKLPDYFREHIFLPLGMSHTELTDAREAGPHVVRQYDFIPGRPPVQMPYPTLSPMLSAAGDNNSTAGDMAKWLIAQIAEGKGPGPKILSPKYFALMHARHVGNNPDASGFGMNFFVYDYNGEKMLEHYGSLQFRSLELMMMHRKIGIFVTFGGGGEPRPNEKTVPTPKLAPISGPVEPAVSHSGARAAILEHFLGKLPFDRTMKVDLSRYVGTYRNIARPAGPVHYRYGGDREVKVADSGDGGLVINGIGVYRPAGKNIFTLDGTLPLDTGFAFSNRYVFAAGPNGTMRMFSHVNAGGFERAAP